MKTKQWKKVSIIISFLALAAVALSGCSGSDGAAGAAGKDGKDAGGNATVMSTEQLAALSPVVTIDSVTIASPPVVKFTVKDSKGNGIAGLGFTNQTATATAPSLANLRFELAKLTPSAGSGAPSKWVNYIVTTVPTKNATTGAITASVPTQPTYDNTGTLVDNGSGSYTYTFYRDITKIKDEVAAATVTAPNVLADLGDLTYDKTLTHRLVMIYRGTVRGTGTNTADGSDSGVPAVSVAAEKVFVYDFIPSTGKAVASTDSQREITTNAACASCHYATPGHRGADVRNCVMCHTDQIKYSRANVDSVLATTTSAASTTTTTAATTTTGEKTVITSGLTAGKMGVAGTFTRVTSLTTKNPLTDAYTYTDTYTPRGYRIDGETLADFPVMIHKIHMGTGTNRLSKTGYGYNVVGLYLKGLTYTQSPMNCTKCHVGDTTAQLAAAPQANNWKTVPTRVACGACHDGINFTTGGGTTTGKVRATGVAYAGHYLGGAQTSDKDCVLCHSAASIVTYHTTNNSTPLNLSVPKDIAGTSASVFTYEISGVTTTPATSGTWPVVTFRILEKIGTGSATPITLRTLATASQGTPGVEGTGSAAYYANADGKSGLYPGSSASFTGGPSFLLFYSTTGGVDFDNFGSGSIRQYPGQPALNVYLADLMTGTGGSITGPNSSGYYVATLKNANAHSNAVTSTAAGTYRTSTSAAGAAYTAISSTTNFSNLGKITTTVPVSFPTGATMRAVQMLGSFTQVNLAAPYAWTAPVAGTAASGGLIRGVPTVVKYVTGDTARRTVVTMTKCQACHEEGLGHQSPLDMANCVTCHNPMLAAKSSVQAASPNITFSTAGWNFKSLIHTAHQEINKLGNNNRCQICHSSTVASYTTVPSGALPSTIVASTIDYTTGASSFTGAPVSTGVTVNTNTDTITSPYASACLSCHTKADTAAHARANGSVTAALRSTGGTNGSTSTTTYSGSTTTGNTLIKFVSAESCTTCHGVGKTYDVEAIHAAIAGD